ncbi:MAG: hypothetical protein GY851_16875, partial [bacterium]|nr:hypothetical protein [bacterium]
MYSQEPGPGSGSVELGNATGDYDRDGATDLFLVGTGMSLLYAGDGVGGFTWVDTSGLSAATGKDVAWADVDNDGDLDLLVVGLGANALYLNNTIAPSGPDPFDLAVGSWPGDMAVSESVVFADVDLDGDVDGYVANQVAANVVYLNDPLGAFSSGETHLSGVDSYGAVFGDFDNDGYPDLYVANDGNDSFFLNDGTGAFGSDEAAGAGITNAVSSRSCQALDYDNDGWLDVFVSNNGTENVLYRNDGDVDGDGWDGTFSTVPNSSVVPETVVSGTGGSTTGAGMGAAVGDIDNDGDVDIWQVNTDYQPAALFRNNLISPLDDRQNTPGRNWLEVRLTGTDSNTSAIGARVELWRNGAVWQTREVSGGSGWRSQNSPVQHFGLGDDEFAEEVLVYWPSGNVTQRTWVAANEILAITEAQEITAIQLVPGRETVAPGDTVQFTAEGIYTNGDTIALVASELFWEVADTGTAYVDASGTVLGIAEGTTYLTAQQDGLVSYPAEVIVAEHRAIALVVSPDSTRVVPGESIQYTATAFYAGGPSAEVIDGVTWYTSAPSVASIGYGGVAQAHAEGTVTIEAEYRGVLSDEVELIVTDLPTSLLLAPEEEVRLYRESGGQANPFTVTRTIDNPDGEADTEDDVTDVALLVPDDPFAVWMGPDRQLWTARNDAANLHAAFGGAESNEVTVQVRDH